MGVNRISMGNRRNGAPKPKPTAETRRLVAAITKWVEDNAERESILLTPDPHWVIDGIALLDHVYEITGVPKPEAV